MIFLCRGQNRYFSLIIMPAASLMWQKQKMSLKVLQKAAVNLPVRFWGEKPRKCPVCMMRKIMILPVFALVLLTIRLW
jgi:hypothetical protein